MGEHPQKRVPVDEPSAAERDAQREAAVVAVRQMPFVKVVREAEAGGALQCPFLDSLGA